jgi:hypothetical protein
MMVDKENPLYINLDLEKYSMALKDKMEYNEISIPPLYNSSHQKFLEISHLYSIYYDSYQCILCGLYHPGIMLMGQLMEVTLKEIIFVHDNDDKERMFEQLLSYSENATGRTRTHSTAPLLPKEINNFLRRVKEDLRNPYMHLNYTKLFQNDKIKVIKFHVGETFQEINQRSERILARVQQGELPYIEINPAIDKLIADRTKRENEPSWAINWAWQIYPRFELLVDEYLTHEDYQKHTELYGTKVNEIPAIDDDV